MGDHQNNVERLDVYSRFQAAETQTGTMKNTWQPVCIYPDAVVSWTLSMAASASNREGMLLNSAEEH